MSFEDMISELRKLNVGDPVIYKNEKMIVVSIVNKSQAFGLIYLAQTSFRYLKSGDYSICLNRDSYYKSPGQSVIVKGHEISQCEDFPYTVN